MQMVVMRVLDPRIHPLPNNDLSTSVDCRVEPGNHELGQST